MLAALVPARCLDATAATKEESNPPESSTPNGTSVINLFTTACIDHTYFVLLYHQERVHGKRPSKQSQSRGLFKLRINKYKKLRILTVGRFLSGQEAYLFEGSPENKRLVRC